jgi:hypothetical protein
MSLIWQRNSLKNSKFSLKIQQEMDKIKIRKLENRRFNFKKLKKNYKKNIRNLIINKKKK